MGHSDSTHARTHARTHTHHNHIVEHNKGESKQIKHNGAKRSYTLKPPLYTDLTEPEINTSDSAVRVLLLHSYLFVYLFLPSFSVSDGNEVWFVSSFSTRIYLFFSAFLLSLSQATTKCGPRPPSLFVFMCLFIRSFFLCLRRQRNVVRVLVLHSYICVYLFLPSFSLSDGSGVWPASSFSTRIYLFVYSFLLSLFQTATRTRRSPSNPTTAASCWPSP